MDFVVIDTETTGLFPEYRDRMVEIAMVRLSADGEVLDEYCSLVNPKRSVGASWIHGITAEDVTQAPLFGEIAGDVIRRLDNAIIVGHNVRFDQRFLEAEVKRLGTKLPQAPALCTVRLAPLLSDTLPSRKLKVCCEHFGIPLTDAHSALADARASAAILKLALEKFERAQLLKFARPLMQSVNWNAGIRWPQFVASRAAYSRDDARRGQVSQLSLGADW